ncbi:MAG: TonB-dependent receptor [Chitinophagales bacterium]|nr:TonB-dependent receptor [Chitinophagales bacterium]
MKNFLLIAAWLCFAIQLKAQSTNSNSFNNITGKIIDEKNSPVEFATITLLSAKDSSLVKGEMSEASGAFSMENIASGNYFLEISYVGYQQYSNFIQLQKDFDAGNISLQKNINELAEVVVQDKKPLIERDNEKVVMNVESSNFSSTGNALDVLQRAPAVIVDNDGNIRLKGKQGVLVMIDGKETYLSADQLANQLRNTPADAISKIEVISNPGAKYEAQGNAGIINIVTKKNKKQGFNGNITGSVAHGELWSYHGGLNLNYRDKKYNLFGSYNYSNDDQQQLRDIWRTVIYNGDVTILNDYNTEISQFNNNTYKAGIDYFVNDKNTVGFIFSGFNFTNPDNNLTNVDVYDGNNVLQSSSTSEGDINGTYNNVSFNLNYDGKFDSLGRGLSANADYSHYNGLSDGDYTTTYFDAAGNQQGKPYLLNNYNPTSVDIKSIKLDYTHPLKNKWKLEAGTKLSYVVTDNDLQVSTFENESWRVDTTQSNHFKYTENINAAYVSAAKQFKNWSVQAGLRGEQTIADGNSITIENTFSRNYFQLFPSASVNYDLNEKNNFAFFYSRRIDRPRYQDLNPFVFYLDQYLLSQGNPNLQPQLTHSLSLSYTFKKQYTFTADYSYTKNNIIDLFYQNDSTKITYETPGNFDHQNYYDVSFYAPFEITKWWSLTPSVTAYYISESTQYNETIFSKSDLSWNGNLQNTFQLPKGFSVDLSAFYQSAGIWSIAEFRQFGSIDLGLKKSLMNGQATLKFTASDILNTNHIVGNINYANIDGYVTQNNDTRQFTLSFSYRFGKQTAQAREHRTGDEEEKRRVKTGS